MGFMTLEDFRDDVKVTLGVPAIGNTRVDRAIHRGYSELCAKRRFEALRSVNPFVTVAGTGTYSMPSSTTHVDFVLDQTNKRKLLETSVEALMLLDTTNNGKPRRWGANHRTVYLRPVPDGAYNLDAWIFSEPAQLTTPTSPTVLENAYDSVVGALAKAHLCQDLGRLMEVRTWLARAEEMLRGLPSDLGQKFEGDTQPFGYAFSQDDLTEWLETGE